MSSNYLSAEFPLPKGKYEGVNPPHSKYSEYREKNRRCLSNLYNNELPDLFKLDTMEENKNGYHNPYLDEVLTIDRNEEFKKMNTNRKHIKIIDFIKSKREYSQNPEILKYIRSDFDIEMQKKRERVLKEKKEEKESYKFTLTEENEPKKGMYINTLKKLNKFTSPLSFIQKRDIIKDNVVPLSKSLNISPYDKNLIKSLKCYIEPQKSSYLKNLNCFNISEAENYNMNDRYFHFDRKPIVEYNPIKDIVEEKKRPQLLNQKWESFYENFFLLMNQDDGYQRKGGLFSEFTNKNIDNINFQKENDRENRIILEKKGIIKNKNKYAKSERNKSFKELNSVKNYIKQMPESLK